MHANTGKLVTLSIILGIVLSALAAIAQADDDASTSIKGAKVNINTATPAQLALLPNVGERTAAAIVAARTGKPFANPAALCSAGIPRFGGKSCEVALPYVTVTGPTTATAKIQAKDGRRQMRDVWVCAEDGDTVSCDLYEADGSLATTVRLPKSASIGSLFPARKGVW